MGYLFALFVNSGIIKSIFGDYLIPDITLISFTVILITLIGEILLEKRKVNNIFFYDKYSISIFIIVILFTICILISSLYTQSPEYWKDKITKVLFLTVPSFLIPCFFFKLSDIKKFIIGSIAIYCITILSLLGFISKYGLRLFYMGKKIGPHYLIWASFISFNSLLFIGLLLEKLRDKGKKTARNEWKIAIFALMNLLIIFISGARGPLLFFLITLFGMLLMMFIIRKRRRILVLTILFGLCLVTAYLLLENISKKTTAIGRSERVFSLGLASTSVKKRIELFEETWNLIKEKPFLGYGVGSFSYITEGVDKRTYPHNLILEIWVENGFIATFMFIALFSCCLYLAIKRIKKPFVFSLFWVNIYFILHLMKSSSLTDARVYFAYAGILFAVVFCSRIKKKI